MVLEYFSFIILLLSLVSLELWREKIMMINTLCLQSWLQYELKSLTSGFPVLVSSVSCV